MHIRLGICVSSLNMHGRATMMLMSALLVLAGTLHPFAHGSTLKELIDGSSLIVGNSKLSEWELISLESTSAVGPNLSQIAVVPLSGDLQNPGVQYIANGQLSTSGIGSIDMLLKFRIHALAGGASFTGQTLALTNITFGSVGGIAYISDEIRDNVGNELGSTLVIADNEGGFSQSSKTSSFAAESGMFVTTNLFVSSMSAANVVHLNVFSQRFAQTGPAVLAGDYNNSGAVDAADYVLWRQNEGTRYPLPNDLIGGTIGAAQYNQWRANFGKTVGYGAGLGATGSVSAVPEPTSAVLVFLAVTYFVLRRTRYSEALFAK